VSHPQIILVHSLISAHENLCAQQSAILSNGKVQFLLQKLVKASHTSIPCSAKYTFLIYTKKKKVLLYFNLPYTAF